MKSTVSFKDVNLWVFNGNRYCSSLHYDQINGAKNFISNLGQY